MERMKKLVGILYELSVVSESLSELDSSWRLVKAQDYIQDVIGDLEEKIYE